MTEASLSVTSEYRRVVKELTDDMKVRLKEKGMTQRDLSDKSGVNYNSVSTFLSGRSNNLSLSSIIILAKALDMRVGVVFDRF